VDPDCAERPAKEIVYGAGRVRAAKVSARRCIS
jgi:hypothetical protein